MFTLFRWLVIMTMLSGVWMIYDVYRDMSEHDQQTMLDKLNKKKVTLYERAKAYVHELLD